MESPSHAWAIGTIAVVYGYGVVCYKHVVNVVICSPQTKFCDLATSVQLPMVG